MGWLGGATKIIRVQGLAQCLAHSECLNISSSPEMMVGKGTGSAAMLLG